MELSKFLKGISDMSARIENKISEISKSVDTKVSKLSKNVDKKLDGVLDNKGSDMGDIKKYLKSMNDRLTILESKINRIDKNIKKIK